MKVVTHPKVCFFAVILSIYLPACSIQQDNSEPITRTSDFPKVLQRAKNDHRYVVMHSGLDTFAITSMLVERGKKEFTVHLNKVDSVHKVQMNNPNALSKKMVHLYMRDSISYTLDEPHTIPLSKVERIQFGN